MILANVRQHLTRDDAQLALRLIGRGSSERLEQAEDTLREQGIDALLDDPRLLSGLIAARQGAHASLPLFAYVVVRNALREVGEDDRVLADYVASILLHFGLGARATRVSNADDEQYTTLAELSGALESADAPRSFMVRAHLGNYALWMSGVFPDYIETRRWRRGGPHIEYYEEMGRRGFTLAADHRLHAGPQLAHSGDEPDPGTGALSREGQRVHAARDAGTHGGRGGAAARKATHAVAGDVDRARDEDGHLELPAGDRSVAALVNHSGLRSDGTRREARRGVAGCGR